jgi:hypothetical protein
MSSKKAMLKRILEFESIFLNQTESARLKENYNNASDDDAGIKKKYEIITRFNAKRNAANKAGTGTTTSEIETARKSNANVIEITEPLNLRETQKVFKHIKLTFDKSDSENVVNGIAEQATELLDFINTSEQRKIETEEQALAREEQELEEKKKALATKKQALAKAKQSPAK